MTVTSGNRSAVALWIEDLERDGVQPDPRTDIDTASLQRRFPHLDSVRTSELVVPVEGGVLPARMYLGTDPRVALVWVHGGGYIHGSIDSPEAHWTSLELASRGVAVVSVEYRKALGGVRYPTPLRDVQAGWDAARAAFAEAGVFARIGSTDLHLAGASAGGNLAACLADEAVGGRDAGAPASVVLLYPLAHAELPPLGRELRQTLRSVPDHMVFTADDVSAFSENYVGGSDVATSEAFAANRDLRGLPPTLIVDAERDSLRASGEHLAAHLAAAGVAVTAECQPGIGHGHVDDPTSAGGPATFDRIARWLLFGA